ncbi:hypothetical protein ADL19_04240 [Streptomyces purpurogeneiscleroticus]|nr:hypothetical protein ADL19_04240 [Streptomyces purpurogeneiscleroticus]
MKAGEIRLDDEFVVDHELGPARLGQVLPEAVEAAAHVAVLARDDADHVRVGRHHGRPRDLAALAHLAGLHVERADVPIGRVGVEADSDVYALKPLVEGLGLADHAPGPVRVRKVDEALVLAAHDDRDARAPVTDVAGSDEGHELVRRPAGRLHPFRGVLAFPGRLRGGHAVDDEAAFSQRVDEAADEVPAIGHAGVAGGVAGIGVKVVVSGVGDPAAGAELLRDEAGQDAGLGLGLAAPSRRGQADGFQDADVGGPVAR